MAKGSVTQRSVEALKCTERDEFLWDDKLAGFGVRCLKGTGRRSFVVQWKREGRTRQVALGQYPLVKAEEARRQAVELLAAVSRGEDPAANRDAARSSPTVAEVCDRWLALGVGPKGRLKRPTTLAMDRSRIDSHIRRHDIGGAKIRAVTAADVRRWLADVMDGKTAVDEKVADRPRSRRIVRGGAGVAARTLRMLKAMFAYAVRHGLIAENPARDVHAPEHTEKERERYLSPEELARLGKSLSRAKQSGAAWQATDCIKLLLATGLRKDEALSLRWSDIDFERRRLGATGDQDGTQRPPAIEDCDRDTCWHPGQVRQRVAFPGEQRLRSLYWAAEGLGEDPLGCRTSRTFISMILGTQSVPLPPARGQALS